ncbi:MAG TPA: sigma 54-interacting transcriptional regulator, partial [Pseudomonadota bacterium]|nr:sigma 54-interacting transcriptional regulator [Pseudomonadota bacterium]
AVGKCTKVPLLERNAYVVVQWKQATFNLDLERWLQTVVYLYNSGPAQKIEESWQFLAASPDRMRTLLLAKQIAPTDSTVLLYGRSGAGKDVLARDIHRHSARSKGPFIAINCGALPETIIESELFGTRTGDITNTGVPDHARLPASYACNDWTSTAGTTYGSTWVNANGGVSRGSDCTTKRAIACCE